MRTKTKNWKRVCLCLDEEAINLIDINCGILNLNKTEFIELLIHGYSNTINPNKKLEAINLKKEELDKAKLELEKEVIETNEQIKAYNIIQESRNRKKELAIKAIRNSLLDNNLDEAERRAKAWSSQLGINELTLLNEAKKEDERQNMES